MNKSMAKRKERSDKGKPRKSNKTPEYRSYVAKQHAHGKSARMPENRFLELLASGCSLCGSEAHSLVLESPYCIECYVVMRVLDTESKVLALVKRISAYRL